MTRHPIRFGVQAAPQQVSWAELREVWQEVEELGFDMLWVNDHLLPSVGPAVATMIAVSSMIPRCACGPASIFNGSADFRFCRNFSHDGCFAVLHPSS